MIDDRRRRLGYLEQLVARLDAQGLVAHVIRTRSGTTFLQVINPEAANLSEAVTCAPAPPAISGATDWYFWWSWGERMHHAEDPAGAADKVVRVLRGVADPTRARPSP